MGETFKHSPFVVALTKIGKLLHPLSLAARRRLLEHFLDELAADEARAADPDFQEESHPHSSTEAAR